MCLQPWEKLIEKLKDEWQELTLYVRPPLLSQVPSLLSHHQATVLLNANVAFLAIPSVDPGINDLTAAQIVSYISVASNIGSVITGLLLTRRYCLYKPRETIEKAVRTHLGILVHLIPEQSSAYQALLLSSKRRSSEGIETLAILFSLPYALLMWG